MWVDSGIPGFCQLQLYILIHIVSYIDSTVWGDPGTVFTGSGRLGWIIGAGLVLCDDIIRHCFFGAVGFHVFARARWARTQKRLFSRRSRDQSLARRADPTRQVMCSSAWARACSDGRTSGRAQCQDRSVGGARPIRRPISARWPAVRVSSREPGSLEATEDVQNSNGQVRCAAEPRHQAPRILARDHVMFRLAMPRPALAGPPAETCLPGLRAMHRVDMAMHLRPGYADQKRAFFCMLLLRPRGGCGWGRAGGLIEVG